MYVFIAYFKTRKNVYPIITTGLSFVGGGFTIAAPEFSSFVVVVGTDFS